jgi:hypothetical protein
MFRPYTANFSQLFTYSKCLTALVPKSKYFYVIALSLFTLKFENLFEKKLSLPRYFPSDAYKICLLLRYSVNNDNAIAWKYTDLKSSAVWQFRRVNIYLKDGKVRTKDVAINGNFNVILN